MSSVHLVNAPACERNRQPILQALTPFLKAACEKRSLEKQSHEKQSHTRRLLEIGSGTGQHAAYFSQYLSQHNLNMVWQPSDIEENIEVIDAWRREEGAACCLKPIALDLHCADWKAAAFDFVFTANTLHIVAWHLVENFFQGVSVTLRKEGLLFVYGPFNYGGNYSSESNRQFDGWLKERDPYSAIRDIEAVEQLARENAMHLCEDIEMPANNRLLVFQKKQEYDGSALYG